MSVIIAATDLSPRSAHVAGRAAQLAGVLGARVILVHALRAGTRTGRIRAMRRRLEAVAAQMEDTDVAPLIVEGKPEVALAALAAAEGAELMVLGLHRPRAVLDLLRLTTMEKLVLAAEMPALIAHHPASPYRRVLAAVDFAPACAAALRTAARLAPGASLHAIHALHVPLLEKLPGRDPENGAARQATADCAHWLERSGLPVKLEQPEIVPGGVHEVLQFRLEELGADLLAIGTHSGRDPAQLGNFARDLMRAPPTDVLVAKPD